MDLLGNDGPSRRAQLVTRQRPLIQLRLFLCDASTGKLADRHRWMAILAIGRYGEFS